MTSAEEPEDQEERQVVCSGCLQVFPEALVHVIPHFNDSVAAYVTTYRCGGMLDTVAGGNAVAARNDARRG
jgi:hypothetical protein